MRASMSGSTHHDAGACSRCTSREPCGHFARMLPARREPPRTRAWPMWAQGQIKLDPLPRGYHLITPEVLEAIPQVEEVAIGILHLFLRHTSASLTLNENASPDVR